MSAPTFGLWHPVSNTGRFRYEFDVRPLAHEELNDGSSQLIEDFLEALGIRAEPSSWDIRRFRTSYYADDQAAPDWRDRYPVVYRVTVACDRAGSAVPEPRHLGPTAVETFDPTWQDPIFETAPEVEVENCRYIVVADVCSGRLGDLSAAILEDGLPQAFEAVPLTRSIVQVRIELESLVLPTNEYELDHYASAVRSAEGSSHWATTISMRENRVCE